MIDLVIGRACGIFVEAENEKEANKIYGKIRTDFEYIYNLKKLGYKIFFEKPIRKDKNGWLYKGKLINCE